MTVNYVAFAEEKLKKEFGKLESGKFEEKQLYEFINRAIEDLKKNPFCGIRMSKKLTPEHYIKKYGVNEIWKYDLPRGWRLIYTISGDSVTILSMILEWFNHKDYEKRFNYLIF